jgi:toxin ParE1/3/4
VTRCRFSALAVSDLEAIGDFIARDNPRRAVTFVRGLQDYCHQQITARPSSFPLREDLGRSLRMAVHGRYLIFFTPLDDGVLIERVVHGARNLKDLP